MKNTDDGLEILMAEEVDFSVARWCVVSVKCWRKFDSGWLGAVSSRAGGSSGPCTISDLISQWGLAPL